MKEKELTAALYELPKIVQTLGNIADAYSKMTEEEKGKLVWEGTKAIIAGAIKYDIKKSIPPIYSMFLQNAQWQTTIDWLAGVLKKYGGDGSVNQVLEKAAEDFIKNGVENQPAT